MVLFLSSFVVNHFSCKQMTNLNCCLSFNILKVKCKQHAHPPNPLHTPFLHPIPPTPTPCYPNF